MAELNFYSGTMDCGKSTLALQMDYTHRSRGRVGRVFTSRDRAGEATVSSRLGLAGRRPSRSTPELHFWHYVVDELTHGGRIDYLVCDEAQFYTRQHVDQLAKVVDELSIDVFAFGILTDFRYAPVRGIGAARRARRPRAHPPGRGAVLVRAARHPQRPHRERRDGHRG